MRIAFLFLIGLLLGACVALAPAKDHAQHLSAATAADLGDETVALVADDDALSATCSGVWVAAEEIVTAAHCVAPDPDLTLTAHDPDAVAYVVRADVFPFGSPIQASHTYKRSARVALRDPAHDLALLRTSSPPPFHTWAQLGEGPGQGQTVQTMGHSMGLWFSYSSGNVAAIRTIDFGDPTLDLHTLWVQSTTPISRGNSGGGLFDLEGNLLGVCSRQHPRGQNINLFVHRDHVVSLIAKARGR
jgi:S1-C subfamily serine protease